MLSIIRRSGSMSSSSSSSSSSPFSILVLVICILTPVPTIAVERTGSNRHPYNNHPHPHHDLQPQPPPLEDDSYRTQESFDTFGGALGPLRAHLEPVVGLLRNNKDYQGPTTSYDDYHKYGGIGGKKLLFPVILNNNNNDGYQKQHYFGDSEHSDQGLNKYSHEHKRDKYGGKSGNHKDHHDTHVYTRNRGYGYEKHYMFDKEYSTGKSSGSKNGHHSFYGDHDHSNKFGLDMHKNFHSKKFAGHKSNQPDLYANTELPLLLTTSGYNDYALVDNGDNLYGDKGGGGGGAGFLKHKKEFHQLKKHLDHHHHHHHDYDHHLPAEPLTYAAKVQEYVPIIETYGGTMPNIRNNDDDHHQFQYLTTTTNTGGLSSPTYGTIIDPHTTTTYYTPLSVSPNAYNIGQQQHLPEDSFYSSSSSQNSRIANNTETEGESINTLNPIQSSVGSAGKVINTAPLISTRLSPITLSSTPALGGSSSAVAESFARIQSAVHATPPIIATHVYPPKHL